MQDAGNVVGMEQDQATKEIAAEYEDLVAYCRQVYANVKGVEPEDIAQETIIRALSKREAYEVGTKAKYWLRTISYRTMCNMWRRAARVRNSEALGMSYENLQTAAENPEASLINRELLDTVLVYANALSDEHRQIWLMRDVEGMSYRDIGLALGMPIGTVMSRIFRARRSLSELVEGSNHLPEYRR